MHWSRLSYELLSFNIAPRVCRCYDTELQENEKSQLEEQRANRSLFVQDLLVSTLESVKSARPEELLPIDNEDLQTPASATSDTPEGGEAEHERCELADLELINLDDVDHKEL